MDLVSMKTVLVELNAFSLAPYQTNPGSPTQAQLELEVKRRQACRPPHQVKLLGHFKAI
jgi:hypothetical protein